MPSWTKAQEKAIYEPSGNGGILVSAAAGSGKTAVLVERIADALLREENPVSIENLLVVTFTDAAADEMKERIANRLNGAYTEAAKNGETEKMRRLKEQTHLIAAADIDTIDAFCLGVVKNNFHILGVDPNFGIMDKQEYSLLMDDVLTELFAELYASEDEKTREDFEYLARIYSSNRDDDGLKIIISRIYTFIQKFAEPKEWLYEKADMYSENMAESKWVKGVFLSECREDIIKKHEPFWTKLLHDMLDMALEGKDINPDSYKSYADIKEATAYWGKLWVNVCRCHEAITALKRSTGLEDIFTFYNTYIKSKSALGNAINAMPPKIKALPEDWQRYYDPYNYMRDVLRKDCEALPLTGGREFNEYVHAPEIKRMVDLLVWLTCLFDERFEEKKAKRNIKYFSDIEHLAYRLFKDNENIRDEYREKYTEILIDEYQDTNGLQDSIFRLISRGGTNIFMVGDLKQSIYRFRGGDPTIFKEKNALFADGGGSRIMLSQNFRSRGEVLRSVNDVFEKMMSDGVGDVRYGSEESLRRDEEREYYPAPEGGAYRSEFHNISIFRDEAAKDADMTVREAEAECIAERVRGLIADKFQVFDGKDGTRDISYRDIVILMRSVKNCGAIASSLEKRGIPVFVQKEEYFERREIKLMLSLLTLINNHRQDIPLAAVMRSPIGGFSDNDLAVIKLGGGKGTLYNAVKYFVPREGDSAQEKLLRRCRAFIASLDRWRGYVKMKSIASLIWTLYEETGIYDFMGALEGGEEAQANLKLMYERAKKYEASGFKGIFNFIRYIERMESRSEDISGARLINESHNVVRIMTIHKSKGLEFPVVFLAGTSKKLPGLSAGGGGVVLHAKYGIGVDYYNYEDMYCKKLMFTQYINEQSIRENRSEEMRIMYVAMTRAREKLIVTSADRYMNEGKYEEKMEALRYKCTEATGMRQLSYEAKSMADWILPSAMMSPASWDVIDRRVTEFEFETEEAVRDEVTVENPEELKTEVDKILSYTYRYPASGVIPAKTSVTAIKEMADELHPREENPVYMSSAPAFMRSEAMGARIGTAHHQVMAYIDLDRIRTAAKDSYAQVVLSETERIANEGQIEAEIISDTEIKEKICKNVCGFFRSDMGKRVLCAKRVYREKPFEIAISAREYDMSLDESYESERVVQGIIDLYFEEEDGDIILVDYKTDRCHTEEEQREVARKYKKQLDLYSRAMEKILKRNVKEKYLYLFSVDNVVKL